MDWNEDGLPDLLVGDEDGAVWIFLNSGTKEKPKLNAAVPVTAKGKPILGAKSSWDAKAGKLVKTPGTNKLAEQYSKLHWADWNHDGLKDLLIGHTKGEIVLYLNEGKKGAPQFGEPFSLIPESGPFPFSRPSPFLKDWNGDGLVDLLSGSEKGLIYFYPNKGTNEKPRYVSGEPLKAGGKTIQKGSRARIELVDWNNDGKMDLLLGDLYGKRDPSAPQGYKSGGNIWLFLGK